MGTIGDITALLEKLPTWKRLKSLPTEMEELRERVAKLEAQLAPAIGAACPICNARAFKRSASKPHKIFGDMGMVTDHFLCSECGHQEDRDRETMQR